ncbi:MAG TPA: N-acetyltransferase [Rhodobacteraceae bacterium]|nr:N-acetyltransferase [Paracoccaceae bacterium]
MWPEPLTLRGRNVVLEPLSRDHCGDLQKASALGELYRLWYTAVPAPEAMADEIDRRLDLQARGSMLPFATCLPDGTAIGMTTYMNIDAANKRLEIGHTWLGRAAQKSPVNTEAKRLMLAHAFDDLDCIAVEFRTHFMNAQSRAAIERLGAKQDGILRAHMRLPDGSLRDTVVYSITAAEWPAVRAGLDWHLARPRE